MPIPPEKEVVKDEEKETPYVSPSPYKPKIPFPQMIMKSKVNAQFTKFIEMLKKVYVNVPFTEDLSQMPTYVKFLKEILSKKRKL